MTRHDPETAVARWLSQFEEALSAGDAEALRVLFHADSHWRDVLALTWRIETVSGGDAIVAALLAGGWLSGIEIDPGRTPPRPVMRAGEDAVEAIFRFETASGRGDGVLRLTPDADGTLRAWTLLTALEELKGHEEQVGARGRTASPMRATSGVPTGRPAPAGRRLHGSRSRRAGGGRRPGRAVDRRAPQRSSASTR